MLINSYTPSSIQTPTFKSSVRQYKIKTDNPFVEKKISNFTTMFREDLDWDNFTGYLTKHFKDKNKVNVKSIASSDGSEGYSLAMTLMNNHRNESKKFFPIYASDRSKKIIEMANGRKINLTPYDTQKISEMTGNIDKYFTKVSDKKIPEAGLLSKSFNMSTYSPTEELSKTVEFKQSTIEKELENLKDTGNSVILCRNVFPYLNNKETKNVLDLLHTKLAKGSVLAIGNYDSEYGINGLLKPDKFKNIMPNVYEKM